MNDYLFPRFSHTHKQTNTKKVNNKVLALLEPPIQLMIKDPQNIRTPKVIPPIMNGLVSMKADFEVYSKYIIDFDEVTTLVGSLSSSKPKFGNFLVEAQVFERI